MDILYSRALAHFVAAYDQRNIRRAAAVVGVTQPAITKSIQKLEAHIGTELFDRTAEGVRPTPIALTLRRHAQNILNEARFVETEISSLFEGHFGNVRFGVGPAWSLTVFPRLLEQFCARFPRIDVEVETGVTDHLLPRLEEGEIDFWLGSLHGVEESDEVLTCPGGQSELRLYARAAHPLASAALIPAAQLLDCNWATFVHDRIGLLKLAEYFADRGLAVPRVSHRMGSMITMFRIASQSDLLVLIADTVGAEARAAGLVELRHEGCIWEFSTGMAYRRNTEHLAITRFLTAQLSEQTSHEKNSE